MSYVPDYSLFIVIVFGFVAAVVMAYCQDAEQDVDD